MLRSFLSPALAGLLLFTGCTSGYQKLVNKPVVSVNQHTLSSKEFANRLARKLKAYDSLAAKDPGNVLRVKNEIIRDFTIRSLIIDFAAAKNFSVEEAEVEAEVNKHRSGYPDDLSFRRSLAKDNLSFSEWRDELKYNLLEKAVFKNISANIQAPKEEEIRSYYEQNKERYKHKERIFISQIVVSEEAKLDAIKQGLKTASFKDYAEKFSIAPEGRAGGVVGWIEKGSVDFFDPLFSVALNSLQTIKSPFGVHLVKVEKKSPAGFRTLEEVRKQIVFEIRGQREQAAFVSWLDNQLRSSKILKNVELIEAMKVETYDDKK